MGGALVCASCEPVVGHLAKEANADAHPRLNWVLPLAVDIGPIREASYVLCGLEAWTTWFDVRYTEAPGQHGQRSLRWEAEDDAGTRYVCVGMGASGSPTIIRGEARFVPAVAEGAKEMVLRIVTNGQDVLTLPIDLQRRVDVHVLADES